MDVKLLRWLDRIMVRAIIPVSSFGWVGSDQGAWRVSGAERERFHAHNRRIDQERITLRKLANRIAGFKFKFWGIN